MDLVRVVGAIIACEQQDLRAPTARYTRRFVVAITSMGRESMTYDPVTRLYRDEPPYHMFSRWPSRESAIPLNAQLGH